MGPSVGPRPASSMPIMYSLPSFRRTASGKPSSVMDMRPARAAHAHRRAKAQARSQIVLPPRVRQQAAGELRPRRPQARGRCASQPPTVAGPCVGARLGGGVPPPLEVDGGAERACIRVLRRPVMPAEARVARRVPQVAQPERRRGGSPILGAADERRARAHACARARAHARPPRRRHLRGGGGGARCHKEAALAAQRVCRGVLVAEVERPARRVGRLVGQAAVVRVLVEEHDVAAAQRRHRHQPRVVRRGVGVDVGEAQKLDAVRARERAARRVRRAARELHRAELVRRVGHGHPEVDDTLRVLVDLRSRRVALRVPVVRVLGILVPVDVGRPSNRCGHLAAQHVDGVEAQRPAARWHRRQHAARELEDLGVRDQGVDAGGMPFLAKEGGKVAPHAAVVRAELVRAVQLGVALAERQPRARVVSAVETTQLARGLEPLGVTVDDPLEVGLYRREHLRWQHAAEHHVAVAQKR
eukprot:scaffold14633_cov63-Phaeocystis_antarctica.AAC.4